MQRGGGRGREFEGCGESFEGDADGWFESGEGIWVYDRLRGDNDTRACI